MLRFGTDGIRGNADDQLGPAFVRALGIAAARVLGTTTELLIGRDTRASGPRIAADLAFGYESAGGRTRMLDVLPTPGIALRSAELNAPAAVISASHNPWFDNGVKFFAPGGVKLSDAQQDAFEAELVMLMGEGHGAAQTATDSVSARARDAVVAAVSDPDDVAYVAHLQRALEGRRLDGLRVVLDTGHGASFSVAPRVFAALGAEVITLHDAPNGQNINDHCGSTHPQSLQAAVGAHHCDLGLAFDGDADRCIAVDETGALIDGDQMMVALALDFAERGELAGNALVVTVMSNLGLHLALRDAGIGVVETAVGDRQVMAAIEAGGYVLGGEQSGHVIVRNRSTTGDGTLTGLLLADIIVRTGQRASALAAKMKALPQVMINVRMAAMPDLAAAEGMWAAVAQETERLGGQGRVLVRASGTEPLIRVMVEAPTRDDAQATADRLATVVAALVP